MGWFRASKTAHLLTKERAMKAILTVVLTWILSAIQWIIRLANPTKPRHHKLHIRTCDNGPQSVPVVITGGRRDQMRLRIVRAAICRYDANGQPVRAKCLSNSGNMMMTVRVVSSRGGELCVRRHGSHAAAFRCLAA
jgi:hypothetical protein